MTSNTDKLNRNDIITVVAHLIAEQGLENLTMRNIARHVGCSVGTLPHYFEGKTDIVIAALNWSGERIFGRLNEMNPMQISLDNLYPIISTSMPLTEQADIEWRVRLCLWDYAVTDPEMKQSVSETTTIAHTILESLIVKLQNKGEIRKNIDPESGALMLYHLCVGAGFSMLHLPFDQREKLLLPLTNMIDNLKA